MSVVDIEKNFNVFFNENQTIKIAVDSNNVIEVLEKLKNEYNFIQLIDLFCVDDNNGSERFRVIYRLLNLENHYRLEVQIKVQTDETLPSVKNVFKNATVYENEVFDLYGVNFKEKFYRFFTGNKINGFPMRKDFEVKNNINSSGRIDWQEPEPQRHTTVFDRETRSWGDWSVQNSEFKGSSLFKIESEGEIVYRLRFIPGHAHKGLEKILENSTYHQSISLIERLNLNSSLSNSLAWVKAVEELCEIELSDRSIALRMIFSEISRIYSHLCSLSDFCISAGLTSLIAPRRELKKTIEELVFAFNNHRGFMSVAQIGGFLNDIGPQWITQCLEVLKEVLNFQNLLEQACTRDSEWMSRIDTSKVDSSFAIQWGYTGAILRSCGVSYDIRKVRPYYFYSDLDFDVPLGINGGIYDRYLVKMEEVRQSVRIISQILDNIPNGPIMNKDYSFNKADYADKTDFYNFINNGIQAPEREIYSFVEGDNGELGFSIFSNGSDRPSRVKIRSPYFPIVYSLEDLIDSITFNQLDDLLQSFAFSTSEIER